MKSPIFFPHSYLPNSIYLRHQFLTVEALRRMHSSDRPARDSKDVKAFIKAADFCADLAPTPGDDELTRRMISALTQAYETKNATYVDRMGKFGVERASTKTVNLCRISEWPVLTEKMKDMGFIKPDLSETWCMSTPSFVQMMASCGAVLRQEADAIPRSTNDPLYDTQAVLLETLPILGGKNGSIARAALSFRYAMPEAIELLDLAALSSLREALLPIWKPFGDLAMDQANALEDSGDEAALKSALQAFSSAMSELRQKTSSAIQSQGLKPMDHFGEYRWYPKEGGALAAGSSESGWNESHASLSTFAVEIAKDRIENVRRYPGCFIWTLEAPKAPGGIMNALFGWMK